MTKRVTGNVSAQFVATLLQAVGLADQAQAPIIKKASFDFADGNSDNQANFVYSAAAESLGSAASKTYDLNASLTDAFGNSITATKLKALLILPNGANANDLQIGAAASHPIASIVGDAASDLIIAKPGGMILMVAPKAAGYAIVAATSDVLQITNAGSGTVTYDIAMLLAS